MKRIARNIGRILFQCLARLEGVFDPFLVSPDVPMSKEIAHRSWVEKLLSLADLEGASVLEVGSREVCGPSTFRKRMRHCKYVGFDYYAGPNVDIVGDAHRLSSYFPPEMKFDLVFSSACFEHFAMPWVVAQEIAKLVRVGGIVFVETHFSFKSHERPWHFFQFSDMGLRVLFPQALGFDCIEAGLSNPIAGRFSSLADKEYRYQPISGLYCHSEYLGRKVRDVRYEDFSWNTVDVRDIVGYTTYPAPAHPTTKTR